LQQYEILEGSIDDLKRPLVRIEARGFVDSLVAIVDTGFNGAIIVDAAQAIQLGFQVSSQLARTQLATRREENFLLAHGRIFWLGEHVPVSALVLVDAPGSRPPRVARKARDEIIIGTELLANCRVNLDFPARKVLITRTV
jgi:predicted aspartyl protease